MAYDEPVTRVQRPRARFSAPHCRPRPIALFTDTRAAFVNQTGAGVPNYTAREILLAASARAVLAALQEPLEQRRLSGPAIATLRVLQTALEPYAFDLPRPQSPPRK